MLICNTFLHSVSSTFLCLNATLFLFQYLLKLSTLFVCNTLSPIQTYKTFLYLLICNTFLHSVSSTFLSLNATLFLFQYLLKFSRFVCLQHFSQIYTYKTFLYLLICNTFSTSVILQLLSICWYATLFLFQYLLKFSRFVCLQHFSQIYTYKTFLYLLICNTFSTSVILQLLSICLYARLFCILYL